MSYIPTYIDHGRDILPTIERQRLARAIQAVVAHGVTQSEIAVMADLHKARITRVLKPEVKNGREVNYSRAYAERIWQALALICLARKIPLYLIAKGTAS